jgi:hypothetical protein
MFSPHNTHESECEEIKDSTTRSGSAGFLGKSITNSRMHPLAHHKTPSFNNPRLSEKLAVIEGSIMITDQNP